MTSNNREIVIEALEIQLKEKNAAIIALSVDILELEKQIANHACPCKVGDILTSTDGESTCKVESIYHCFSRGYGMRIRKFKKDKTPYVYASDMHFSEWVIPDHKGEGE